MLSVQRRAITDVTKLVLEVLALGKVDLDSSQI
jgi:hypothetical protein